jgi:hypothetical protein
MPCFLAVVCSRAARIVTEPVPTHVVRAILVPEQTCQRFQHRLAHSRPGLRKVVKFSDKSGRIILAPTGKCVAPILPQHDPPHRPSAAPSMPVISRSFPARPPHPSWVGCAGDSLPLPGADCADDDARLVEATAASQRQVDQRHVPVSAGHQGGQVKPDGMPAGATPGRYVIAMRDGSRRRQSICHPGSLPPFRTLQLRITCSARRSDTEIPTCEIIHRAETTW